MWIELLLLATAFLAIPPFIRWIDRKYSKPNPVEANNFRLNFQKRPLELAFEKDFLERTNEHQNNR